MNRYDAAHLFTRAGCRTQGFGNGCNTCPIRKEIGTCPGKTEAVLRIAPKLYRTDKKYRASVDIELKDAPTLKEYLQISAKII